MNQIELQSISEQPSQPNRHLLNPESISQLIKSESVSQQPAQEDVAYLNISFHIPESQTQTESYLSISFQEILKLIFTNESPQLVAAITSSVEKSLIIIKFLTLFVFIQIIAQFIDLYVTLMGEQSIKQLVIGFFCFKIISDGLLMYSLYQTHYTIVEAQLINDGDVSHTIIEFLKHISKTNSPLEGFDDEQLTQAQQVANIIAQKVTTFNWLNFLVNHLNGHLYSINRIIMISQIIIFIWGNIMLVQWGFSIQDWNLISIQVSLIIFSMTIGYLALLAFLCGILLVCLGIPVLILMIIWQSCSFCSTMYWTLREHYLEWRRQRFIRGLRVQLYQQVKKDIDQYECAICLSNYGNEDRVIQLPCNGHIGHLFHDDCIKIWIETCGSCPICRTRFQ
ncbi:hypothetical protein pb186bvf_004078 [Paramecium bursaria]